MRREIPEGWLLLMQNRGIDSGRALADRMGVSQQTVQRMLHGEATSPETIHRASDVLGVPSTGLWALRGEVPVPPFVLPREADNLTPKQRAAVLAVVRSMLDPGAADEPQQVDTATVTELHPTPNQAASRPAARRRPKNVGPTT